MENEELDNIGLTETCIQGIMEFYTTVGDFDAELVELMEQLRVLSRCDGVAIVIARNPIFNDFLHHLLFEIEPASTNTVENRFQTEMWHMLSTAAGKSSAALSLIWSQHGEDILKQCRKDPINKLIDLKLMIVYNVYINCMQPMNPAEVLTIAVNVWIRVMDQKRIIVIDFLLRLLNQFIEIDGHQTVAIFKQWPLKERVIFLTYLIRYLKSSSKRIHFFLMQHIIQEFKNRAKIMEIKENRWRELSKLVKVVMHASNSGLYAQIGGDQSLFSGVTDLLAQIILLAQKGKTKLNNFLCPESLSLSDLESDCAKCIASLVHANSKNKTLCLESGILVVICNYIEAKKNPEAANEGQAKHFT